MLRKIIPLLLVLVLSALVGFALAEDEEIDVTKYTYKVTPIYKDYYGYLYVATDNPDPMSFRLRDPESVYLSADATETPYYANREVLYADVRYEDKASYRVKGGYILRSEGSGASDGGKLVLQQRKKTTYNYYDGPYTRTEYVDTDVSVSCRKLKTGTDMLIEAYTDPGKSFFENLDAVEYALSGIATYPRPVQDKDALSTDGRSWPMLTSSPYEELSLNEHTETMYEAHPGGILLQNAYPFVLDSLGFPGTVAAVARKLEPTCVVDSGSTHWLVSISFGGTTKTYGGAGNGGYEPLYTDRVKKLFTFDNSSSDWFASGDAERYSKQLLAYDKLAKEDAAYYMDMIEGDTYKQTIAATGGTWIRIATEGFGYGTSFAYIIPYTYGCRTVSNAWVDGRYVDTHERIALGATFSDYPNANIVMRNMTFTDDSGVTHTQDVLFSYNADEDNWKAAPRDYYFSYFADAPAEFTLTRKQVEAMKLDGETFRFPRHALIYDGKASPGTPCETVTLTFEPNNGKDHFLLGAAELGEPYKLPYTYQFSAPDSPVGMSFGAWRIDGVDYEAEALYTPKDDAVVQAIWKRLSATALSGCRVSVKAACEEGETLNVYCGFYDRSGRMVWLLSDQATASANQLTFDGSSAFSQGGAVTAKVFLTRDGFIPVTPGASVELMN